MTGPETATRLTTDHAERSERVTHVVLHHAATTSLASLEYLMEPGGRTVSAHYAVKDRERVLKVPLDRRAYSLGSPLWDSKAVTVECANESVHGWTISAASHESLALIVAHAAERFGFTPHRSGDPKTWTVLGHREVYSIHGASYATACPGGMDIERVTRRARQLIEAPAPIVPSRKADPVILIQRAEGSFECSLFHPSISGPTPLERGYVIVTDLTVARGLARIYGKGWGPHQVAPRDVYVEQQAAARVAHAAYLRGLPKPPEAAVLEPAEFAAVAVDLSPVLDALKAQPAAVVAALKAAL